MKYTPGPWEAIVDDSPPQIFYKAIIALLENNGQRRVTVFQEHDRMVTEEEQVPNAQLIAAAPELLEIAIEIEKIVKQGKIVNSLDADSNENLETITRLRKIINKAKGELNELHSK